MARQKTMELPQPVEQPAEIIVRMGPKPCMTSKGMSAPGQRISHGIIVPLPAHEAENLINLGYATHV